MARDDSNEEMGRRGQFIRLKHAAEEVESVDDLYDFVGQLIRARDSGVFIESDIGVDRDVDDYLEGVRAVLFSQSLRDKSGSAEPPSWSLFALIFLYGFTET